MLMVFKEGVAMPGLLLGGNGQALCACSCKRTEVRRYGAPVPQCLRFSKKEMAMTRCIEALLRSGLQSRLLSVPSWAHHFLPIMAQDFSPGRPCVVAGL